MPQLAEPRGGNQPGAAGTRESPLPPTTAPTWADEVLGTGRAALGPGPGRRRAHDAVAARINQRRCGDITYIATWEGWLYLLVIDIATRRVAGFALADHLRTELAADALANAVAARDPAPGVIFHSDRSCPGHLRRVRRPGQRLPGRLVRRAQRPVLGQRRGGELFASLKGELIDTPAWPARAAACRAIVEYIGWYNGTRLHSTPGYRSPADFENDHHGKLSKVA